MAIVNIIDHRKRPYRFKKINAVVEAAWHDNSVYDSDQVGRSPDNGSDGPSYEEREHISYQAAITWGNNFGTAVTLYIYDEDGGIYPVRLDDVET